MIVSVDAEKPFDNIQQSSVIKLSLTRKKAIFLNFIRNSFSKAKVIIIFNSEQL